MTPRPRPTWRDAAAAAATLTPARRHLLHLLSGLPLAPVDLLARLSGVAGPAAVYRHLGRLCAAGLAEAVHPPLGPRRSHRLWHPTDLGLATLGLDRGVAPATLARAHGLRRHDLLERLRRLPGLLALYRLLGALAAAVPGLPGLLDWEAPWRQPYRGPGATMRVVARLPARVALAWRPPEGEVRAEYLLWPDLATAPLAADRAALDRLFPCRTALERAGARLPELLVATDARRADAWAALLEELRAARRDTPLSARIVTWDDLDADVRAVVAGQRPGRPGAASPRQGAPALPVAQPADTPIPRPVGRGIRSAQVPGLSLRPGEWALLDLLARHATITRDLAARALGWDDTKLRRCRGRLVGLGLARLIPLEELGGRRGATPALRQLATREPTEATAAGLATLAAWHGLTPREAVRWNGYAGGGPDAAVGTRTSLLAAPLHTLGVEEFFANLARRARHAARRGADAGLVEWRNAAACARKWFRPDGYVAYRRGDGHHAAFVEYDRGTMGPRDWAQKLAAYFAYRDSGRYRPDYAGFPATLIVVAIEGTDEAADREVASEATIAGVLRTLAVGRTPLPALLTTATRLAADPAGPLGPVWREADAAHRRPWLRAGSSLPSSCRSPGRGRDGGGGDAGSSPTARAPPRRAARAIGFRGFDFRRSAMINRYLSILIDELRAEGIADPLAHSFTLAALWDDLATLAGELPPASVRGYLAGDMDANDPAPPPGGCLEVGGTSRDAGGG